MNCAWSGDYHSISFTLIQFHSLIVTPLTDSIKVTIRGPTNCYSHTSEWHNGNQSVVISITVKLVLQYEGKLLSIQEENLMDPTLPRGTSDTTLSSLLRLLFTTTYCDRLVNCQNRKHKTADAHRASLKDNYMMVDAIQSCTEVMWTILACYPLANALCKVSDKHKSSLQVPRALLSYKRRFIGKLGGWKHTFAFHESFKSNRHQALEHHRQYNVMGIVL